MKDSITKKTMKGLAGIVVAAGLATGCASNPVSHPSQYHSSADHSLAYSPGATHFSDGTKEYNCNPGYHLNEFSSLKPICLVNYLSFDRNRCGSGENTVSTGVTALTKENRFTNITAFECVPKPQVNIYSHPGHGQGFYPQQHYGGNWAVEGHLEHTKIEHTEHPHHQPRPQPRRRGR